MIYSAERIAEEVRRLAAEISADYAGEDLLLVIVLQGAFIFAADLVRQLRLPLTLDFVKLASYSGTETTGRVVVTKDTEGAIAGKNVLIVEDIVDTGLTLAFLLELLRSREPKSLRVCALIDKPARRRVAVTPDYVGMVCKGGFLVGYGLDVDGKMRELPAIYEVNSPERRSE
jgi:hypoxanthine phosphoribosyltransferase